MAVKKASAPVELKRLNQIEVSIRMIGQTPLYFNRMSAKAQRTLLIGGGKKTNAEKKELKHNPEQEFVSSIYTHANPDTLICFPAPGIKGAMATAALETPGVTKSSVQRLVYLPEQKVRIWGIPQLKMDVVRSADMNRTPDIRTRGYLPQWCSEVKIRFIDPTLTVTSVSNLLQNAGMICGIGDFRVEKGKGGFGAFSIATPADKKNPLNKEWQQIVDSGGRKAQETAMSRPELADEETAELMAFLMEERQKRAS